MPVKHHGWSRWQGALVPIGLIACLLAVIALPVLSPVRMAAGLMLTLILPGVAVGNALLPELAATEPWIRLLVSVALSLAVTSACALVLALLGVAGSTVGLPVAVAATGLVAAGLAAIPRFGPEHAPPRPLWMAMPAVLLLAGILAGVWIGRAAAPAVASPFTVFSVVGPDGTVESLPRSAGCAGLTVTLSVASHENGEQTYEVWEAAAGAVRLLTTLHLAPGASADVPVTLPATQVGKVTFELRRNGGQTPYRSLDLCAGG
jgi:uncharacterized membrane protein